MVALVKNKPVGIRALKEMRTTQVSKFQIEADWLINTLCNYSCTYCFSSSIKENELAGKISPEQYLDFFDFTGKVWLFHFTGGEPFFYPQFVRLCETLTASHYVSINSNLSSEEVLRFAYSVDPNRVDYIHCGVHLEQRESHEGFQELLKKIQILVDHGFALFATHVMTPSTFKQFQTISERFADIDVPLVPKALRGIYEGKHYPTSYTLEEREKFTVFSRSAENRLKESKRRPFRNQPTVNPLLDKYFLDGFPDFSGVTCSAGKDFVRIDPDGNIYRCGKHSLIGNIFERTLQLYDSPRPCDDNTCPYMCIRYTGLSIADAQKRPKDFQMTPWHNRSSELIELSSSRR